MPRIPEGNFNTTPSSRVSRPVAGTLNSKAPTQLRRLGKNFLGAADQLDKAEAQKNKLDRVHNVDEAYDQSLDLELDGIFKSSTNGRLPSNDPMKLGEDVDDAVMSAFEKFDAKAQASLGDDPEALDMYFRTTRARAEKKIGQIRVKKAKQVHDHTLGSLNSKKSSLVQRAIDEPISALDIVEFDDYIDKHVPVVGEEKAQQLKEAFRLELGAKAADMVDVRGIDKETVGLAKNFVSGISDEGLRRQAKRNLDKSIETVKKRQVLEVSKRADRVASFKDNPAAMVKNKVFIDETSDMLLNSPLAEYETVEDRLTNVSKIIGAQVYSEAIFNDASLTQEEFNEAINSRYEDIARGLSSTQGGQIVGEENMKNAILSQAQSNYANFVDKRSNDLMATLTSLKPDIPNNLRSGNENLVERSFENAMEYYDKLDIPREMRFITSKDNAEAYGKQFYESTKGMVDITGDISANLVEEIKGQYKQYSAKAMNDMIRLGGGLRSGETKIPPFASIAVTSQDSNSIRDYFGDINQHNMNVKKLDMTNAAFERNFKSNFKGSMDELYLGNGGENAPTYLGYKQALEARTSKYMVDQNLNSTEAFNRAMADVKRDFPIVKSSGATITLSKDFAKDIGDDMSELEDSVSDLKELRYLDKMNVEVDYDTFQETLKNSPLLAGAVANVEKAKSLSPEKQRTHLLRTLGDDIHILNDPYNENSAGVYFKTINSGYIPIPVKGSDGPESMLIDLKKYHGVRKSTRFEQFVGN